MIRIWHIAFFVAALAVFAIARAPANLIAQREGAFAYERARGTIWKATFERTRLGTLDAGDIEWRLSFGDLVQGKMNARARLAGRNVEGDVNILANWRGDRRLIAPRLRISRVPVGPGFTLEGDATIDNLDVYFSGGRCVTAQGALASDIPSRNGDALGWRGPNLAGRASCAGEKARLTLAGANEADALTAAIELGADGEGVWRLEARSTRAGLAAVLGEAGLGRGREPNSASIWRTFRWFPF